MNRHKEMQEFSWRDGIVATDAGDILARPKMTFQELRNTPLGASGTVEEPSPGYKNVIIMPVLVSGYECCVEVSFEHDFMKNFFIFMTVSTAKRFSFVTGYSSPPDGPEVRFLEDWVRQEVGKKPPVKFKWGDIYPVFDSRSGFARILFIYK